MIIGTIHQLDLSERVLHMQSLSLNRLKLTGYSRRVLVIGVVITALVVIGGAALAQEGHEHGTDPESDRPSPIPLNPAAGSEIGFVYEAFLSPHQEGGEEEDTPPFIPAEFRSTQPSVPRNERTSRGHAVLEFTNDLSRVYVHLAVENVNIDDLVMLHLHCGLPGQLGPIIVDFSTIGNIQEYLADGVMSVEVTNEDLEVVAASAEGLIGALTAGCPIVPDVPSEKVVTIAGLETIARQGQIYFNLHTAGQVYFGDIRGKFQLVGGE
jgi:hypothetical protein